MLAIGLMSGTSLDGCDCALVEIKNGKFYLKDYLLYKYDDTLKSKIKNNLSCETAKLNEICSLNFELAYVFKNAIDNLLCKNSLTYDEVTYIASHGQTIWHQPVKEGDLYPSTLQIGSGQVLSALTKTIVVSNFRVADMAINGEGAPLVPMFQYIYFKNCEKNVALQNIGGIGNVTYIKKNADIDDVVAFDTGPGNVMIDYFMKKYFNKEYDEDGKVALKGNIIKEIYDDLIKDEYFLRKPPKSTGREKYSFSSLEWMQKKYQFDKYSKEDIITTITEITVYGISHSIKSFLKDVDEIIVSGGGCHNKYIMNRLNAIFNGKVYTLDDKGLNSDAVEAFAFAVLGYLTLHGINGNVSKATGAKNGIVLGDISQNFEGKYYVGEIR